MLGNIRTEVAFIDFINLLLLYLWIYIMTQFKIVKLCINFSSIIIGHLSLQKMSPAQ